MTQQICQILKRSVAAMLSVVLLCGLLMPNATVWALDESDSLPAEDQPLILQTYDFMGRPTDTIYKDGDAIATLGRSEYLGFALCRGVAEFPVPKEDAEVKAVARATGEQIPEDILKIIVTNNNYAEYRIFWGDVTEVGKYLGKLSPDFGIDLVFTSGDETLTLTIANENVQVTHPRITVTVGRLGISQYGANNVPLSVTSKSLNGIRPTMEWVAKDVALEGEIAEYLTFQSFLSTGMEFVPTEKMSELALGQIIRGNLTWVGKLDGQSYSLPIYYRCTNLMGRWCEWVPQLGGGGTWTTYTSKTLKAGDKGSFYLQIYPGGLMPQDGATPLTIKEEYLTTDLPEGIKVTPQSDGTTLLVEYKLNREDAREQPYTITVQVPGVMNASTASIQVEDAPVYPVEYEIVFGSDGDNYYYQPPITDSYNKYKGMTTLKEEYAVVPLVDDAPVTTLEELEQCGLTIQDSELENVLRIEPREITYYDQDQNAQTVWALCIMPLFEESYEGYLGQTRDMLIKYNGETVETVKYDVEGTGTNSIGGDIQMKTDRLETRTVNQVAERGRKRYLMRDEDGNPLVLTQAPTVSGEAAQNLDILWVEGLSGIVVNFNAEQVPGRAVVELRSGDIVRKLIIDFKAFKESDRYYSLGMDYLHRPYGTTLQFTQSLSSISNGGCELVNTARFIEDGSFDIYLSGMTYISDKNYATIDEAKIFYSFGTELIKRVTYTSSDEEILRIEKEITHTEEKDSVYNGNGYSNPDGNCYGIRLVPGGKTGTCDVYATIELYIPSKNDPYGCDISKTPTTMTIGHTFTVSSAEMNKTVEANPDNLLQVLDSVELDSLPTVVLLEGGTYAMDLNFEAKNVILRSKDPENPAVFTGAPGHTDGFIIVVNSPANSFALENIVVDGGGVRGGIKQIFSGDTIYSVTIRNCTVKNCTSGIIGVRQSGCILKGTTVQNCEQGVGSVSMYFCTLQNNTVAAFEGHYALISENIHARWTKFVDNDLDIHIDIDSLGPKEINLQLPQNYWNGASGPSIEMVDGYTGKPVYGKTLNRYTSPYYIDESLYTLNIDMDTVQQTEDGTLILPLEKTSEGYAGMMMTANAFAVIQKEEKAAVFPILNEQGENVAVWKFASIQYTDIDTNMDVSLELSEQAKQTVDQLPQADKDKILQEVNLSHNGTLPGRATLAIKASEVPTGNLDELYLYWVKPDGTIVPAEVIEVRYDEETQTYYITVDHCSEYIITSGTLSIGGDGEQGTTKPTATPTVVPTTVPSATPTATPSAAPSMKPTETPSAVPSAKPTATPSAAPSAKPSATPTATPVTNEEQSHTGNATNGNSQANQQAASTAQPGLNLPSSSTAQQGDSEKQESTVPQTQFKQSELYSAQQVMDAFAAQKENVTLDTTKQSKVSQKVFELLKERPDASLRLEGDGCAWVFTGNTINDTTLPNGVFDTAVTLGVSDAAQKRIESFAEGASWQAIETAFSGVLPGSAKLEVTVPALGGTHCELYLLPDEGEPEYIAAVDVDQNGKAALPLEHCSVYFLVVKQAVSSSNNSAAEQDAPAENSTSVEISVEKNSWYPVALAGLAVTLALAGAAVWTVKRKK